jgi:chromosome segregation ATPase
MQKENTDKFKLTSDDQDPDMLYQEELKELRIEKLSHRITLIAILLPCILALILYVGYRAVTGSISKSTDTGAIEIQRLSQEMETFSKQFNEKLITFSTTLSSQDKDFEKSLSERLAELGKNIDGFKKSVDTLQNGLKQMDGTIKSLDAAKADKKGQEMEIAKITKALEPLQKEVKELAALRNEVNIILSDSQSFENKVAAQLSDIVAITEKSRKDVTQLQASMAAFSNQKIDEDFLDLELLKLRKNYEQLISQAFSNLNGRLEVIQRKIDDMQKISSMDKQSDKTTSIPSVPSVSTTEPIESEAETLPPSSGTIIEQDIQD